MKKIIKKVCLIVLCISLILLLNACFVFGSSKASNKSDYVSKSEKIVDAEQASTYLTDVLTKKAYTIEEMAVVPQDDKKDTYFEGKTVWYFAWGKSESNKFTAEEYFAVEDNWDIWIYNVFEDMWSLFYHEITIADGVIYKYSEIKSDPGENLSQYDAAVGLYKRALVYVYTEYKYDKDNPIYIECMGMTQVEEDECYFFEVDGARGKEYFMVSYGGNIYQMRSGVGLRGWGNINDD